MEEMKEISLYRIDTTKRQMVPFFEEGLYCGVPGDGQSVPEFVEVTEWITDGETEVFFAVVHGLSMKNLGYMPGDLCVVSREKVAKEGDVVVARIDSDFTMKVFHCDRKNRRVVLYPANDDFEPIVVDPTEVDFEVWGVVTKCIKECRSDGLTIIRAFNDRKKEKRERAVADYSDEEVKMRIDAVRLDITTKRKWFCVIKVLMWIHKVPDGDFVSGVNYINHFYADAGLTNNHAYDFSSKLDTGSFHRPLEEWEKPNAPVQGTTYDEYCNLTKKFLESF